VFVFDAYGNMLSSFTGDVLTGVLYTGEQFNATTGQYYLRARYYDPPTGRFNRLDPFAGNTSDPVSLHKYLYAGANPVMFRDPTGRMFSLSGMLFNAAISSVLCKILSPIIKPATQYLVRAIIPDWVIARWEAASFSAVMVGGGGGIMPVSAYGISIAGGVGVEILFSKRNLALYTYEEATLGVGRLNLGTYVGLRGGLVFDSPTAAEYEGRAWSATLSFSFLPSKTKKKMAQQLPMLRPPVGADLSMPGPSKWVTAARGILRDATPHLSNIKSLKNYTVTVFWGQPAMTSPIGFSVGLQLGGSASSVFSVTRSWYQLWGDGDRKF